MVEERQGGAKRERIQPEADLGQLDGHRVQVHAVDAALEHVPLEQVNVDQFVRFDGDALLAQCFENVPSRPVEHERYRVDREVVEERQEPVGDKIDCLDQKVTTPHRRVEDTKL